MIDATATRLRAAARPLLAEPLLSSCVLLGSSITVPPARFHAPPLAAGLLLLLLDRQPVLDIFLGGCHHHERRHVRTLGGNLLSAATRQQSRRERLAAERVQLVGPPIKVIWIRQERSRC